jgi:NAD(P)-dependent dehydrogenase (short-subunit alcohol dehydrogenase family)
MHLVVSASWIVCDVRHQDQVERAVQATVDAYGSLDLAYSNAGLLTHPHIRMNLTRTYGIR